MSTAAPGGRCWSRSGPMRQAMTLRGTRSRTPWATTCEPAEPHRRPGRAERCRPGRGGRHHLRGQRRHSRSRRIRRTRRRPGHRRDRQPLVRHRRRPARSASSNSRPAASTRALELITAAGRGPPRVEFGCRRRPCSPRYVVSRTPGCWRRPPRRHRWPRRRPRCRRRRCWSPITAKAKCRPTRGVDVAAERLGGQPQPVVEVVAVGQSAGLGEHLALGRAVGLDGGQRAVDPQDRQRRLSTRATSGRLAMMLCSCTWLSA